MFVYETSSYCVIAFRFREGSGGCCMLLIGGNMLNILVGKQTLVLFFIYHLSTSEA